MKKILCLAASLLALNLMSAFGQQTGAINIATGQALDPATGLPLPGNTLTKFNLDFPGGTPVQLVKAIEKATGKPLNTIVPNEDADIKLPPLKMDDVDTAHLFLALELASAKQVALVTGTTYGNAYGQQKSYSTFNMSYGFSTHGEPSDNSVWYFHADKPALPPMNASEKICQYYSLSPYLDRGFTVDDITTAIQTGWKMSGDISLPELNYHKETKLLIAYGEPSKLKTIDDVLRTLPTTKEEYWQKYWQETHNTIIDLQQQIRVLQTKISPPATNVAPTGKSGK